MVVNMLNHIVLKVAEERHGMGRIGKTGIPKVRPGTGLCFFIIIFKY